MQTTRDKTASPKEPVTVVLNGVESVRQPACFRLCPLGLQFYAPKDIPQFELVELNVHIPGKNGSPEEDVVCSGVVVHSQADKESGLFRVWVKFVDLPDEKRKRLQCVAENSDFLCPYCENF
jgi:hypothetical protein